MEQPDIQEPPAWRQILRAQPRGVVLIAGGSSTGKSTLARFLFAGLSAAGRRVACLDADPGQTWLGPPGTMTLMMAQPGGNAGRGRIWRRFVGSTSPRGHMLPLVTGAVRLLQAAREAGAEVVIYDSSGLIDPAQGGNTLRRAEIDALHPVLLVAIQQHDEMESLLAQVRLSGRTRVFDVRPVPATQTRSPARRQYHRREQYARYFAKAGVLDCDWSQLGVFPAPRFFRHRLLALEDAEGFVVALGIVLEHDAAAQRVRLHTPLRDLVRVRSLVLGDLLVDPTSYQDRMLGPALAAQLQAGQG